MTDYFIYELWILYLGCFYLLINKNVINNIIINNDIIIPFQYIYFIFIGYILSITTLIYINIIELVIPLTLVNFGFIFLPYLAKPSKYIKHRYKYPCIWCNNTIYRNYCDHIVSSSFIYSISALISLYNNNYWFAFISLTTTISSLLYHLHKEAMYFNLDNICATTFLFYCFNIAYDAYSYMPFVSYIIFIGSLKALYIFCTSGDVCIISYNNLTNKYTRIQNIKYVKYHCLWHYLTGFGSIFISIYLYMSKNNHIVDISDKNILLYYLISIILNIIGNNLGIIPFN